MAELTIDAVATDDQTVTTTLQGTEHFNFKQSLQFVKDSGATTLSERISDDNTTLERPLRLGARMLWVTLRSAEEDSAVELTLTAVDDAEPPTQAELDQAAAWATRRFWIDVDMGAVEKAIAVDDYGKELITRFFPARPANYPNAWEALIKSVIHSQIYPGFAQKLDEYLCRNYGTVVTYAEETFYLYPTPEQLVTAPPDDLIAAKFSRQKADFLTTIPQQMLDEPDVYDFEAMRSRDGEEVIKTLKQLHGVGDWTAQNVAMRGLPHLDVFIDEKATRETLTPVYGKENKITKKQVRVGVERFSPYRAFACYYTYMKHFGMD